MIAHGESLDTVLDLQNGRTPSSRLPLFMPRPQGIDWTVAVIAADGQTVSIGQFVSRKSAFQAAGVMAERFGGRAVL